MPAFGVLLPLFVAFEQTPQYHYRRVLRDTTAFVRFCQTILTESLPGREAGGMVTRYWVAMRSRRADVARRARLLAALITRSRPGAPVVTRANAAPRGKQHSAVCHKWGEWSMVRCCSPAGWAVWILRASLPLSKKALERGAGLPTIACSGPRHGPATKVSNRSLFILLGQRTRRERSIRCVACPDPLFRRERRRGRG